jgi:hypothetical protein
VLCVAVLITTTSCNLHSPESGSTPLESETEGVLAPDSGETENELETGQTCTGLIRYLNPAADQPSGETELDHHFRLAYLSAIEADFEQSILNYQQAAQLTDCDCDRLHAEAGKIAARESENLLEQEGMASKPTQFFWIRLQELTNTLPCVEIR